MTNQPAEQACGCCAPQAQSTSGPAAVREQISTSAAGLGIVDDDRRRLLDLVGDCRAVRDHLAAHVSARLGPAEQTVAGLIGDAAATHRDLGDAGEGMPQPVADLHHDIVGSLDTVGQLQAALAHLARDPGSGACSEQCPCATVGTATADSPDIPGFRLAPATEDGPAIVCTLGGGTDAMRTRIGDWQQVVARATDRRPIEGGVILNYEHDAHVTAELARLAAAESACCPFFEFSLSVGPSGMTFAVLAPQEAQDVVTSMFGAYGPVLAGAH